MTPSRLAGSLILLLVSGCGATDPVSFRERLALEVAEHRWQRAGIRDYDFEYRQSCFCPIEVTQWTRIEVRNSAVARAFTTSPLVPQEWVDRVTSWPTVEGLFERVRGGLSWPELREVTLRFDPVLGYPTEASFTLASTILDGGGALYVREFVRR